MPRNAKPLTLHINNGNPSHLTKKEIEEREQCEIKLGCETLAAPDNIRENKIYLKKWNNLKKLYDGSGIITTADTDILANYCIMQVEFDLEADNSERRRMLVEIRAMQTALYLTPASRARGRLPQKEPEKKPSQIEEMFKNV